MAFLAGSPVAGIGPKPENAGQMPSVWNTYFAVDSADATAAKITAAGGRLMMPPFDVMGQGRMTVALDPAGAAFGLWQSKAHHGFARYNEPGAVTWNELHTREYEASREFYAQVFGHTYTDIGDGQNFVYATFERPDGQTVGGISHDTQLPDDAPNYWLTWFNVADTDATVDTAVGIGSAVLFPATDSPFGRMAVLRGAQGEVFGVITPPANPGAGATP
jgi:predicted enzyme related to lactoylglutathione lyase